MSGNIKAAWTSCAVGVIVLVLKFGAWWVTGSIALYSDALESIINVVAALGAVIALTISARPADASHPYGHTKAEYFSAVVEGVLVIIAAISIFREAYFGWLHLPGPVGAIPGHRDQRRRHRDQPCLVGLSAAVGQAGEIAGPGRRCETRHDGCLDLGRSADRVRAGAADRCAGT